MPEMCKTCRGVGEVGVPFIGRKEVRYEIKIIPCPDCYTDALGLYGISRTELDELMEAHDE